MSNAVEKWLSEYKDLELSTQILAEEAFRRGYSVDVLDRKENFIRIRNQHRYELVKQASRTRKDSYISPLIMENKGVTKQLLMETGIEVPRGEIHYGKENLDKAFARWKNRPFVLKPNSTNFGKAVFLFPQGCDKDHFNHAVASAFAEDSAIILEEMESGKEYRFLIIGDSVPAVLHRIPANIIGDGLSTIKELVIEKNQDPRRGKGYVSPLEKISMKETETLYLQQQGLNWDSIPQKGKQIFLRENSNISTGGDSIDFTDNVHPGYKDIALAAAKALGAKIAGADIIIKDIKAPPSDKLYSVIEMNFNPALHIHNYPFQGKNRQVEKKVLDLLNLH